MRPHSSEPRVSARPSFGDSERRHVFGAGAWASFLARRVPGLVAGARDRLAELGRGILDGIRHVAPDPLDQLLDRFVPPPSGSKDWLDVEIPGPH